MEGSNEMGDPVAEDAMIDIVTVVHNSTNRALAGQLEEQIASIEDAQWRFILVDNGQINRGFAAGCNWGALHPKAKAPIIGFLNPDVEVKGPFIEQVRTELARPGVVICGNRFGKPKRELQIWGVTDWVCGAVFFVKRDWFTEVGGFDQRYVWSHEETDLCRQAEAAGHRVKSIELPIEHASPTQESPADHAYKRKFFEQGRRQFNRKWGTRG